MDSKQEATNSNELESLFISDTSKAIAESHRIISEASNFDSYKDFFAYHIEHSHISTCQNQWQENQMSIHCFDCALNSASCVCLDCFLKGNHKGHNYIICPDTVGNCDCGDNTLWKQSGFCQHHKGLEKENSHPEDYLDEKLRTTLTDIVFKAAFTALTKFTRENAQDQSVSFIFQFISTFLQFGDGFRRLIAIALTEKINFLELLTNANQYNFQFNELLRQLCGNLMNDQIFKENFSKVAFQISLDNLENQDDPIKQLWNEFLYHAFSPQPIQFNIAHNNWDWVNFYLKICSFAKENFKFVGMESFQMSYPSLIYEIVSNLIYASSFQPNEQTQTFFDRLFSEVLNCGTKDSKVNNTIIPVSFRDKTENNYYRPARSFATLFKDVLSCFKFKKDLKFDVLIDQLNKLTNLKPIYKINSNENDKFISRFIKEELENEANENEKENAESKTNENENKEEKRDENAEDENKKEKTNENEEDKNDENDDDVVDDDDDDENKIDKLIKKNAGKLHDFYFSSFHNGASFYYSMPVYDALVTILGLENICKIKFARFLLKEEYQPLRIKLGIITLKKIVSFITYSQSLVPKNFGLINMLEIDMQPSFITANLPRYVPVFQLLLGLKSNDDKSEFSLKEFFAYEMAKEIGILDDFTTEDYKDEDLNETKKEMLFSFLYLSLLIVIERILFNIKFEEFIREQIIYALKSGVTSLDNLTKSYDKIVLDDCSNPSHFNKVLFSIANIVNNKTSSIENENKDISFTLKENVNWNTISAIVPIKSQKSLLNNELSNKPETLIKVQEFEPEEDYFFNTPLFTPSSLTTHTYSCEGFIKDTEIANHDGLNIHLNEFLLTPTILAACYHSLRMNTESETTKPFINLNDHLSLNILILISKFLKDKNDNSNADEQHYEEIEYSKFEELISKMKTVVFKYQVDEKENATIENTINTKQKFVSLLLNLKISYQGNKSKSFIDLINEKGQIGKEALSLMSINQTVNDSNKKENENDDENKNIKKQRANKLKEEIMNKYKNLVLNYNEHDGINVSSNSLEFTESFDSIASPTCSGIINGDTEVCSICSTIKKNEALSYPIFIYQTKFPFIVDKPPLLLGAEKEISVACDDDLDYELDDDDDENQESNQSLGESSRTSNESIGEVPSSDSIDISFSNESLAENPSNSSIIAENHSSDNVGQSILIENQSNDNDNDGGNAAGRIPDEVQNEQRHLVNNLIADRIANEEQSGSLENLNESEQERVLTNRLIAENLEQQNENSEENSSLENLDESHQERILTNRLIADRLAQQQSENSEENNTTENNSTENLEQTNPTENNDGNISPESIEQRRQERILFNRLIAEQLAERNANSSTENFDQNSSTENISTENLNENSSTENLDENHSTENSEDGGGLNLTTLLNAILNSSRSNHNTPNTSSENIDRNTSNESLEESSGGSNNSNSNNNVTNDENEDTDFEEQLMLLSQVAQRFMVAREEGSLSPEDFASAMASIQEAFNNLKIRKEIHDRIVFNRQLAIIVKERREQNRERRKEEREKNPQQQKRYTAGANFVVQFTICQHQVHPSCIEDQYFRCPIDRTVKNGFLPCLEFIPPKTELSEQVKKSINVFLDVYKRNIVQSPKRKVDLFIELIKSLSGLIVTYETRLRSLPDCLDSNNTKLLARNLFLTTWHAYRIHGKPAFVDVKPYNNEMQDDVDSRLTDFQKFIKKLIENDDIFDKENSSSSIRQFIDSFVKSQNDDDENKEKNIFLFLRRVCLADYFLLGNEELMNNKEDYYNGKEFIEWDEVLSVDNLSKLFNVTFKNLNDNFELKPFIFSKLPKDFLHFALEPYNFPVVKTSNFCLFNLLDYNQLIEKYDNFSEDFDLDGEKVSQTVDEKDFKIHLAINYNLKHYPSAILLIGKFAPEVLMVDGNFTTTLKPFYLDKYGSPDVGFSRGEPLFLNDERYERFIDEILSGDFSTFI